MTDCRPCPAGTVALHLGVSGGGGGGGPRSRTGIQPASDAARRSLVLKTGISCDDCPVCVLSAVVRPGHPGSSGISGDRTGSLMHGTGVPILFPSQRTRCSSAASARSHRNGELHGEPRPGLRGSGATLKRTSCIASRAAQHPDRGGREQCLRGPRRWVRPAASATSPTSSLPARPRCDLR